jgi:hypothetical protein
LIGAEARDQVPEGKCPRVTPTAKTLPLGVVVFATVHDGLPAIRKRLALTNRASAAVTLTHLLIEPVTTKRFLYHGFLDHSVIISDRVTSARQRG